MGAMPDKALKILTQEIMIHLPDEIKEALRSVPEEILVHTEEIRLRVNRPIVICGGFGEFIVSRDFPAVGFEQIKRTLDMMCGNSIYTVQEEIKNGFITLKGGHRVGITGRVISEGHNIVNINCFSGLNIRISRQVPGAANGIIEYLLDGKKVYNTIIISPPQCGKTTLVRDIARQLGTGINEKGFEGVKVGIVDERSEIAGCHRGVPQHDVGMRTDVLDRCPKSVGMIMLLRAMSPDVIITDELGKKADKDAVMEVINAGVKLITTVHGSSVKDVSQRPEIKELFDCRVFERLVILSKRHGPGTVEEIIDGDRMINIYRSSNSCSC